MLKSANKKCFFCSVPSILRSSRYRRDQRQMDEEEEMWFNEDEDFDDNETVVSSTATDIISTKDTNLESIGYSQYKIEKNVEANGPKINNNSTQKNTILNNNATSGPQLNPVPNENRSALFKRVCIFYTVKCDVDNLGYNYLKVKRNTY